MQIDVGGKSAAVDENGAAFEKAYGADIRLACAEYAMRPVTESVSVLMMLTPYLPYPYKKGELYVDAYYLVSNRVYHAMRALASTLTKKGVEVVDPSCNRLNYRAEAAALGLIRIGAHNTLGYHPDYGSYCYLHAMLIKGQYTIKMGDGRAGQQLPCRTCGACTAACPNNALDGAGGIAVEKCLRSFMLEGEIFDDGAAEKMEGCVLGCYRCQAVCPMNAHIKPTGVPPQELTDGLLGVLRGVNPKTLAPLLGANVARKKTLTNMLVNAVGNLKKSEYAGFVESMVKDPMVGTNAARALKKLHENPLPTK